MSNCAARAGWSVVSEYPRFPAMTLESQPLASRIDSGFSGRAASAGMPLKPRKESILAMNHASNSLLAITTELTRSGLAVLARASSSGPASAGHPSSQSSNTSIRPSCPAFRAANSMARSSSPAFRSFDAGIRRGGSASGKAGASNIVPIRRSSIGTASTSPCPSTIQTIRGPFILPVSRKDRVGCPAAAVCLWIPVQVGSVAAIRRRCTSRLV